MAIVICKCDWRAGGGGGGGEERCNVIFADFRRLTRPLDIEVKRLHDR